MKVDVEGHLAVSEHLGDLVINSDSGIFIVFS